MNRSTTDPNRNTAHAQAQARRMHRQGASNEGSGSNNTMNLWTWPWSQGRRSLPHVLRGTIRRPKQRPRNNRTKYGLLAVVLLFCLVFRQGNNYEYNDTKEIGQNETRNRNRKRSGELSLAVLVAGSTQRFLFDSFVEHVAKPASTTKSTATATATATSTTTVRIDYFAILTLKSGPAFRQDAGYMGHLAGRDTLFDGIDFTLAAGGSVEAIRTKMMDVMTTALAAATATAKQTTKAIHTNTNINIRALRLLEQPIQDAPVLEVVKLREQKRFDAERPANNKNKNNNKALSTFDLFQQFPMMDKRENALVRTQAGNKNMIRLFLALESLWNTEFVAYNNNNNYYDYVLFLRDDTLWLGDFDISSVIATDPTADAYILSCDGRDPKMLPPEINDHGVLIRSSKAHILGRYVTAMGNVDLQQCHDSVTEWLGKDRGCNSEMILRHVLEVNNIKVKLVPQSILPFERAVLIDGKSGNTATSNTNGNGNDDFYCYHKFCQSIDQPLELPSGIQRCKELTFHTN